MTARRTKFYLDKQHAKFLGVCSGIADYTGVEAIWVRIAAIVLFFSFGWPFLAYFLIAWLATPKPVSLYADRDEQKFWQGVRANPSRSTRDVRASLRDIDRRLADVELYYTSRNTQLANEIDALR